MFKEKEDPKIHFILEINGTRFSKDEVINYGMFYDDDQTTVVVNLTDIGTKRLCKAITPEPEVPLSAETEKHNGNIEHTYVRANADEMLQPILGSARTREPLPAQYQSQIDSLSVWRLQGMLQPAAVNSVNRTLTKSTIVTLSSQQYNIAEVGSLEAAVNEIVEQENSLYNAAAEHSGASSAYCLRAVAEPLVIIFEEDKLHFKLSEKLIVDEYAVNIVGVPDNERPVEEF